ncbi:MAG: hypothetical protein QNJ69_13340 [Gammaproteobacteria bacterium]|nr:hypothetical protein [Gammaproteobacteria bacterium]
MSSRRVINLKSTRLLRKHISLAENHVTLALLFALAGLVLWVVLQKDQFDPQTRDISIDQLTAAPDAIQLYHRPLKYWSESGSQSAELTIEPFPASLVDQEWSAKTRVKQFSADTLFEKINGEADKFMQLGFANLYYLVLISADRQEIAIELFDQADMRNSMGIFATHLSGDESMQQQGEVIYFLTSIGAIGRAGQYFFRIAGTEQSERIRNKSEQIVLALGELAGATESTPRAVQIFSDVFEIASGQIAYEGQNVFQYDFVSDVWFGTLDTANNTRLFIHEGGSSAEVEAMFNTLLEEQQYDYQVVEQGENQVVLLHNFLKNYFVMSRKGELLYGVENITELEDIPGIMQRLEGEL